MEEVFLTIEDIDEMYKMYAENLEELKLDYFKCDGSKFITFAKSYLITYTSPTGKIKILKSRFKKSPLQKEIFPVSDFINKTLDDDPYEIGELESMRNKLERLQGSYTRLLEELNTSKVLTDEQVYYIVKGIEYNEDY